MQETATATATLAAATAEAQAAEAVTASLAAELHQLQLEIAAKQVCGVCLLTVPVFASCMRQARLALRNGPYNPCRLMY